MILETPRLFLRELKQSDFDSLCLILRDELTNGLTDSFPATSGGDSDCGPLS